MLVPTLSPGDVVVMGNLGSHKGKAIRRAGAHLIFLPRHSPDLNPIEQVFAKLKPLLRNAAERTVEATWRRIGHSSTTSHRPSAPTTSSTAVTLHAEAVAI